jgi:hypothetical protein
MENDFLNVSITKKISKSKDTKKYKINKNTLKKKLEESTENKYKSIISNIDSDLTVNNDSKYNINLNTKLLSSMFEFNFDNALTPPQLNDEQILNFKKISNSSINFLNPDASNNNNLRKNEKFSSLSQEGSKFLVNDMHQSFYNTIKTIIFIQSHFRGYVVKKNLLINYLSRDYIKKNSIVKIINIQKIVRSFLAKINIRKKIIIELINKKRKNSIELIIKNLRDYISIVKTKKTILINYCLEQRKIKAIFIQQSFRNYLFYKSFKQLREDIEKNYFLDYTLNAKKVDLLLYADNESITKKKYKKFSFSFNKLLKYFILLINPNQIFSGKYKCQFVANDIIICDNRFPTIKRKNQIFNIIYLIPKNKKVIYKINKKQNNNNANNSNLNHDEEDEKDENDENSKSKIYKHNFKYSLEDIKEEDDEGKSVTSSSKDYKIEKALYELSDRSLKYSKKEESDDDDDFDINYEEYLNLKYKKK